MPPIITEQDFKEICATWSSFFYHYHLIFEENSELCAKRDRINKVIWASYPHNNNGQLTTDQDQLREAARLVKSLDEELRQAATVFVNPHPDPDNEFQELTDADKAFVDDCRERLQSVKPFTGQTDVFAETGTEGAHWILHRDGIVSYETMEMIRQGDRLVVFNLDGTTRFDDIIVTDTTSGWVPFDDQWPYGNGQQCCGPFRSHWIQKGKTPQQWFDIFSPAMHYQALLYRLPTE